MYDIAAEQDAQEARGYSDAMDGNIEGHSDQSCGRTRLRAHYAFGFHKGMKERAGVAIPPEIIQCVRDLPPLLRVVFSFQVMPENKELHQPELRDSVQVTVEADAYDSYSHRRAAILAKKRSLGAHVRAEAFGFTGDGLSSVTDREEQCSF